MAYEILNNVQDQQFEIHIEGKIAKGEYSYFTTDQGEPGIAYIHTIVPPELSGRGIATYLVKFMLDYASQHGLKVKPVCSFVKTYIDKHPEYQTDSVYH